MTTLLKEIADHHLLRGLFCQEQGLWKGKMGMSVFFFLLSRHTATVGMRRLPVNCWMMSATACRNIVPSPLMRAYVALAGQSSI